MTRAVSAEAFLDLLRDSRLIDGRRLDEYLTAAADFPEGPREVADRLVRDGLLTTFQAEQLLAGRYKGFFLLDGQYKVLKPVGRGGMGVVYLCEHLQLHRRVAVKVLPREHTYDRAVLERFQREARAAAALDHPNIVRIHDVNAYAGLALLVMEYAEGENLQEVIDSRGAVPYREAVGYILQAAAGLRHAHERGVIHRDVKPANLMLDRQGVVKVLDMGLARFLNAEDDLTQEFDDGTVLGTADYMSPEQACTGAPIDGRTDIYSLGVTLYALITGRPPFAGSVTQKVFAHQIRDAVAVHEVRPDVPAVLSAVVARMMAKKPEERYATVQEVIGALAPFTEAPPTAPTSVARTPAVQVRPPLWRRPLLLAGLGAPLAALLVVLAWGLLYARRPVGVSASPPGGPAPAAAAPADPPPPPQYVENELYRLNLEEQKPFLFRIQHAEYFSGPPFPDSWSGHCWKDGSSAEVLAERVGDSMALGYRNLAGDPTCQLITNLSGVLGGLQVGHRYVLRVEYQGQKLAYAAAYVRRQGNDPASLASIPLRPTDGRWVVAETTIARDAETAWDVAFCTQANGPETTVYVRTVVLVEQSLPVN